MTTLDIGDEPKQFRHRFPDDVPVAVDGNRVRGVKKLREKFPDREVILLDDVFQHRRIKPGLQILLTDYSHLYHEDFIVPTGNLRESRKGARRADIIIVTKTPEMFSPLERKRLMKDLTPEVKRIGELQIHALVELRRELDVGSDIEIFRLMMRRQWERADRALDDFDRSVFGSESSETEQPRNQ